MHSMHIKYKYLFRKRTPSISVFEDLDFNQVSTVWESNAWKHNLALQGLPHSAEDSLFHRIIVGA